MSQLPRSSVLITLLVLGSGAAPQPALAAPAPPLGLRCEYLEAPLGIDETAPRLSWRIPARGRGQRQTGYQVLVASSPSVLKTDRGDLWDSGKVTSGQSVHVVYRGRPLQSGETCYWKVRTWDEKGQSGAFSSPSTWEMGLLHPSDWKARWVGRPVDAQQEPLHLRGANWFWYPEGEPARDAPVATRYFRTRLTPPASRKIVRASFLLAGDDEYVLYVNGREAGRGVAWLAASKIDVLPLLGAGENVLAVSVKNNQGPAGVMGRLWLEFEEGAPMSVDLDASWSAGNRAQPGWNGPPAAAPVPNSGWVPARQIARGGEGPWGGPPAVPQGGGPSPYLRKPFTLVRPVRRARLYATALGVYELRLNGQRVGDHRLSPGWTEYSRRAQYQTYDVTRLLRRGENVVGAVLGDGWYAGALGPDLRRNHFGPSPARLKAQLRVEFADGSAETIATDAAWTAAFGPILESDLYAGEIYDARRELPGWDIPSRPIDAGKWALVNVYDAPDPELNAQCDPPIRVTTQLSTRELTQPKPGVFVFDLGQNMVGHARLKVRGPAGTRVVMRFAEVLNPDGSVYRDNLRRARATDEYVLRGEGTEVFEPHFTYHGFRYVEVTGFPGTPRADAVTGVVFNSDVRETSRFTSSSELVNRLYENILWGQRANLMSVPTDCPQRDERLGWMGDAQLFARTSTWFMEMAPFYTKWMRDIVDAQSPQGAFSDVSPRVVDMADGAPAWADAGLVVPWTVYVCYGDTRILERSYRPMKRYVDLLVQANPDLLWLKRRNNDFGDWVAAGEATNKDLIASAYLAFDLSLLSRIAGVLGHAEDAQRYAGLANRSTQAFNARFLAADGKYVGDTQTAYAMALGMGLVPPDRRVQVAARLREAIQRRKGHLATGFYRHAVPAARAHRDGPERHCVPTAAQHHLPFVGLHDREGRHYDLGALEQR